MSRLLRCFLGLGALASALAGVAGDAPARAASAPTAVSPLVRAEGTCPEGERVARQLLTLLPHAETGVDVHVKDRGTSYLVEAAGQSRIYEDAGRDCERRAEAAALFAALVLGPLTPGSSSATTDLDARGADETAAATRAPEPPRPVEPSRTDTREKTFDGATADLTPTDGAARAGVPRWWLELGALGAAGVASDLLFQGGAGTRVGRGNRTWAFALGVRALAPRDLGRDGVALRQSRVAVDAEVVRRGLVGALGWETSLGVTLARVSARGTNLALPAEAQAMEAGVHGTAGLQIASAGPVRPFASLTVDLVPFPARLVAAPRGELGTGTRLWLTLTVGARLTWGERS